MSGSNDVWDALVIEADDLPDPAAPWMTGDDTVVVAPVTSRDGERWPDREGRVVVVLGATGGAGATTVACGLALAIARRYSGSTLLDLDFEFGDTHERWDVPRDRTLDDLVPVLNELRSSHLDMVGYTHESGVDLCLSPARHGASDDWGGADVTALLSCAAKRGPVVVDAGNAPLHHMAAACAVAQTLVVVAPATLRGARRTKELAARYPTKRQRVVVNQPVGTRPELSSRAFGAACGRPVDIVLPSTQRDADRLRSGNGHQSRRSLLHHLDVLAETDSHVAR